MIKWIILLIAFIRQRVKKRKAAKEEALGQNQQANQERSSDDMHGH